MGSIMCCAEMAICCGCSCIMRICCCCCKRDEKNAKSATSNRTDARAGWVIFHMIWIVLTVLLMYIIGWTVDGTNGWWGTSWLNLHCPDANGGGDTCAGAFLLVIMSFSLMTVQFLTFCICCTRTEFAAKFNEGCWTFKFLLVAGQIFGYLYVKN